MTAVTKLQKSLEVNSLVHVKYLDHCWFHNADPKLAKPIIQDAYGILAEDGPMYVKLIVAWYADPTGREDPLQATGLVIIRSTILELRRLDRA